MIDEATYDELDRYFHSAMNAREKAAFELQLNASEELRAELAWLTTMLSGMKQQGRIVMKSTIAAVIAAVPAKEVAKYKPSVNGTSFLKKWWWALIGTVVAVAAATIVYTYAVPQHEDARHENDAAPEMPADRVPLVNASPDTAESAGAGNAPTSQFVNADNASFTREAPAGDGKQIVTEGTPGYDTMGIYPYVVTSGSYSSTYVVDGLSGGRIMLTTRVNRRTAPPYTYSLVGRVLTLNANYTRASDLFFKGSGDTIVMTDQFNRTFALLQDRGEQPLVPMKTIVK